MIQWLPKDIPFAKVYKKTKELEWCEWPSWIDIPTPKRLPKFTTFLQNYVRTFWEVKSWWELKRLYNIFIMSIYDR